MSWKTTRRSIMIGIKDDDDIAWYRFVQNYTEPAMKFLSRYECLKWQDREDIWQHVLLRSVKTKWLACYEPEQGRFRNLLIKELENRFKDWHRKEHAQKRDVRKKVEADAPLNKEEPDGETQMDQLENADARKREESVRKLWVELKDKLQDFPDEQGKVYYLEWLQDFGGMNQKAFVASSGISIGRFRNIRKKVHDHLKKKMKDDKS